MGTSKTLEASKQELKTLIQDKETAKKAYEANLKWHETKWGKDDGFFSKLADSNDPVTRAKDKTSERESSADLKVKKETLDKIENKIQILKANIVNLEELIQQEVIWIQLSVM